MFASTVRLPSALIPMVMSAAALALLAGHLVLFGVTREPDEGTSARLWQLLMAGQLPFIAYFALRWLPQRPRQALLVLAVQTAAALTSLVPVLLLEL